jgi:hypothetical protein
MYGAMLKDDESAFVAMFHFGAKESESMAVFSVAALISAIAVMLWPRMFAMRQLAGGFPCGLTVGIAVGLLSALQGGRGRVVGLAGTLFQGFVWGLSTCVAAALIFGIVAELFVEVDQANPVDPVKAWRAENMFGIAIGLAVGFAAGFAIWATFLDDDLEIVFFEIGIGLSAGLTAWLMSSKVGATATAQVYLAVRHRTPLRLAKFLEDARSRHLLRVVGSTYQFRHATLQDRLDIMW